MKTRLATIALCCASAAGSAQAGLCEPGEFDYFSCTAGRRQVALCGSMEVSESQGFIEYRFQDGAAKPFVLPKARRVPLGFFRKDFVVWGRDGFESQLHFQSGEQSYVLYANLLMGSDQSMTSDRTGIYGFHAGVRVYRGDTLASDIECDRGDVPAVDPRRLDEELPAFLERTPRR